MKIINITKNTVLAEEVNIADGFFSRCKGLLGKKELRTGQALILRPCNAIHTFFMRFAIDVLFVDKQNKVIKAIPNIAPFRLTFIYFRAVYAIELPAGTIEAAFTEKGDCLALRD